MKESKLDQVREERITYQIVVDAYNSEERAIGWHCHLEDNIKFPFRAKCIKEHSRSPLKKNEEVTVLEMGNADDCKFDMHVKVEWNNRIFSIPLSQLSGISIDKDSTAAIEDWHYWVNRGYEF